VCSSRLQCPGGAVKTLELTEPGFRHDWAAMNLSLFAGSGFSRFMGKIWSAAGWNLRRLRIVLPVFSMTANGLV
jgi:phytoene dehydrogenase-like protein